MMEKTTQAQLFALLRAGLWNTPVPADITFNRDTDWNAILVLARQQTVLGLVANAIFHLPESQQPEQELLLKLTAQVSAIAKSHAVLNDTVVKVATLLEDNGIVPVLLKGQGVAALYPEPTLRMCGDIDLYVGKRNYTRACHLLMELPGTDTEHTESVKHFHTKLNGVTIELHRIVEQLYNPWQNRRFQRWSEANMSETDTDAVKFDGMEVHVPSDCVNAVYIFNHLWHHFLTGGIGLRQLCDWVMVLHRAKEVLDLSELEKCLNDFGLWKPWRIFGCIAVNYLGLPEKEFPFYDASKQKQAEQILGRILMEGNFGQYSTAHQGKPEGIILGKLHSLRRISRRTAELATLISPWCAAEYYVHFLLHGIAALPNALLGRSTTYMNKETKK
jgi:hypothetical protein